MKKRTLRPCDVIVCINDRKDLFSRIKRLAMGRYEHVELYLGRAFYGIPLLVESDNRGVVIQNVAHQRGRHVRIMRPELTPIDKKELIKSAIRIASDSKSYYDWWGLFRFAAVRVLREKFGINRPFISRYERDAKMICSEAVAEIFWQNQIDVLPVHRTPIPADFAEDSTVLKFITEGKLLEDLVPQT